MWKTHRSRLKTIRTAFVSIYMVILGAAFYYQVIGDASLEVYQLQYGFLQMTLIDVMREGVKSLGTKILSTGALGVAAISLMALINHVLKLRDKSVNERQ